MIWKIFFVIYVSLITSNTIFSDPIRILVIGQSGSGKSTFIKYLINTWLGAFDGKVVFSDESSLSLDGLREIIHKKCGEANNKNNKKLNFRGIFDLKNQTDEDENDFLFKDMRNIVTVYENNEKREASKTDFSDRVAITKYGELDNVSDSDLQSNASATSSQTQGIFGYKFTVSSGPLEGSEVELIDTPGLLDVSSDGTERGRSEQIKREYEIELLISKFVEQNNFHSIVFLNNIGMSRSIVDSERAMMSRYNTIFDLRPEDSEKDMGTELDGVGGHIVTYPRIKDRLFFLFTQGDSSNFNMLRITPCRNCKRNSGSNCFSIEQKREEEFESQIQAMLDNKFKPFIGNAGVYTAAHVKGHTLYYTIPNSSDLMTNVDRIGRMTFEFYFLAEKLKRLVGENGISEWKLSDSMLEFKDIKSSFAEKTSNLLLAKNNYKKIKEGLKALKIEIGELADTITEEDKQKEVEINIRSKELKPLAGENDISVPKSSTGEAIFYMLSFDSSGNITKNPIEIQGENLSAVKYAMSSLIEKISDNYTSKGELVREQNWLLEYKDGFELDISTKIADDDADWNFLPDPEKFPQMEIVGTTLENRRLIHMQPNIIDKDLSATVKNTVIEKSIKKLEKDLEKKKQQKKQIVEYLEVFKPEYKKIYKELHETMQKIKESPMIAEDIKNNPEQLKKFLSTQLEILVQNELAAKNVAAADFNEQIKRRIKFTFAKDFAPTGEDSELEDEIIN